MHEQTLFHTISVYVRRVAVILIGVFYVFMIYEDMKENDEKKNVSYSVTLYGGTLIMNNVSFDLKGVRLILDKDCNFSALEINVPYCSTDNYKIGTYCYFPKKNSWGYEVPYYEEFRWEEGKDFYSVFSEDHQYYGVIKNMHQLMHYQRNVVFDGSHYFLSRGYVEFTSKERSTISLPSWERVERIYMRDLTYKVDQTWNCKEPIKEYHWKIPTASSDSN